MNCLFWNARGIVNSPTKTDLKRLIISYKPQFFFIVEPWMDYNLFPQSRLNKLNLKFYVANDRSDLNSNRWCLCDTSINSDIILSNSQQISFTFKLDDKLMGISLVYAYTFYFARRSLWCNLQDILNNQKLLWCFIGDFSLILDAHEYSGSNSPPRGPMEEFSNWIDHNRL